MLECLFPAGISDVDPRFICLAIVETNSFNTVVVLVAVLDFVFFLLEDSETISDHSVFVGIGGFVVTFFVCEMLVKFYAYGFKGFFKIAWNIVDFIIVVINVIGYVLWLTINTSNSASLIRMIRLLRIFRLLRILHSIGALANLATAPISDDRINIPARKAMFVLEKAAQVFRIRYVSVMTKGSTTSHEISWVLQVIRSGKLLLPFDVHGLEPKLSSFLTDTFSIIPQTIFDPSHTTVSLRSTIIKSASFVKSSLQRQGSQKVLNWEVDALKRLMVFNTTASDSARAILLSNEDRMELGAPSVAPTFQIDKLAIELSKFDTWNFDPFAVKELSGGAPLFVVGYVAFLKLDLIQTLNLDEAVLKRFLWKANSMHRDNLYHSSTHVSDVTQTTYYFLSQLKLQSLLTPLDTFACILAAILHDLDHPGVNNAYLQLSRHPLTDDYNSSIIENYSIRSAFELMRDDTCNVLAALSRKQAAFVRHRVIQMILATDNAKHFDLLGKFKAHQMNDLFNMSDVDHRLLVMQICLHCADISNPTKPLEISKRWSGLVQAEFWWQGDQERELGVTPGKFFDRSVDAVNIPLCQLGFIVFLVEPIFKLWTQFVAKHLPHASCAEMERCLRDNKDYWSKCVIEEKRRKASVAN